MTYRLTLNVLFGVLLCLTGAAMAADTRGTTVSGGTTSSGFVGDEEVTINRLSAGRFCIRNQRSDAASRVKSSSSLTWV